MEQKATNLDWLAFPYSLIDLDVLNWKISQLGAIRAEIETLKQAKRDYEANHY